MRRLPSETPVLVGKDLRQTQEEVQRFLDELLSLGLGDPPAHGDTHDVEATDPLSGGSTPLSVQVGGSADAGDGPGYMREDAQLIVEVGSPVAIGSANADGVATTASRSDHVHKRNVEVRVNSALVGTRRMLNLLQGTAVTLAGVDDAGGDEVEVTINAVIPTLYYQTVQEEGAPLTQRAALNFVGTGVAASDDGGNNRTLITIPGPDLTHPSAIFGLMV